MIKNSTNHIDSKAVKLQLNEILTSDKFLSSGRFTRFLEYIVHLTLSGKTSQIKEYNIGVDVFDRGEKFDPQLDPIVRIYAGRLRQALKDYYNSEGRGDNVKIEIPKGTYVPEFSAMEEIKPSPVIASRNLFQNWIKPYVKGLLFATIALTVTVLILFLVKNSNKAIEEDTLGRASIKIAQFQNLSDISENDQFILRLIGHTEIALGQFSSMLINAGSDDARSKSKSKYTLSGSIQQEDEIIKVTVKLADNQTGFQVFGKEYSESLTTNAASYIEEVFANKIAVDLADEFGELQKLRLRNTQGQTSGLLPHEAVLVYYDYLTHMNKGDNERILLELQKTVEIYDQYEPVWAAISGLYMDKYRHFGGDLQDVTFAKEAIKKAEIINPRSSHVQNHLAQIALADKRIADFYDAIEKQMALNSNSTMLGQVGLWLCLIGNYDRGIPLIEETKLRNPYYPRYIHFGNYFYYIEQGELEKAYLEAEKVNMPLLFWDPLIRASISGHLGQYEKSRIALNELLVLKPNFSKEGNELINRSLFVEKQKCMIIEGLEKIGFKISINLVP